MRPSGNQGKHHIQPPATSADDRTDMDIQLTSKPWTVDPDEVSNVMDQVLSIRDLLLVMHERPELRTPSSLDLVIARAKVLQASINGPPAKAARPASVLVS